MPEQQLKEIVDQMGLKKVNTADKDEMVYACLLYTSDAADEL